MTHVSVERQALPGPLGGRTRWLRAAIRGRLGRPAVSWRRAAKYATGAMLLGIGAFSVYQNVVVRTSLDAVINARIVAIRAPIDGIV